MLPDPILVAMVGRSGSSMVSGILHNHGVWVGGSREGNKNNPKGFFENLELKTEIRKWAGGNSFRDVPDFKPGWKDKVEGIIRGQGYKDGPWLFKHGATFFNLWEEFSPKWIKVRRDQRSIFDSYRNSGMLSTLSDDELKRIISFHHEIMDMLPGVDVRSEDLINGSYQRLKMAFEYCGLDFDYRIADNFISKEYWHFSEATR